VKLESSDVHVDASQISFSLSLSLSLSLSANRFLSVVKPDRTIERSRLTSCSRLSGAISPDVQRRKIERSLESGFKGALDRSRPVRYP